MKILYYSPHPTINYSAPSGPGTHIREVIHAFEGHGHVVVRLICGGENYVAQGTLQFKKSRIKRFIPSFVWQSLKDYRLKRTDNLNRKRLEELTIKEKPDLIYERSYYLMRSGYETARKFEIPYFCEINAPYPEEKEQMEGNSFFRKESYRVESEQINVANEVFTVSTAMRDYLIHQSGGNDEKIHVTPNAVNKESIVVSEHHIDQLRNQFDIRANDKVIGFVGSIFPYHGVDLLLEAFAHLMEKGLHNCKLLIVGDGEILPSLKDYAERNIEKDKVIFTGNVPHKEVYNYISLMDIAVMARSNWYGSPVKIFEYGAMNKAIIAPDVIPVQDVMINGTHGILIKDNAEELLRAIEFLIAYPEEAKRTANAFHHKVMSEHTWHQTASRILSEVK